MLRQYNLLLLLILLLVGSAQTPPAAPGQELLLEAQSLLDSANYALALQRGQQALQQCTYGDPAAADCLQLIGDIFLETGQWDAAYAQYQAALSIYSEKLGPADLAVASILNRIGEFYFKKADYADARNYYQKALEIRRAALGPTHAWVADGYNNLGNCQVGLGQYAEATKLHQEALAIRQQVLSADHPDLSTSFNNLGNCAYLSGNNPLALSFFEKALANRLSSFGPKHPKTAQVFNNLGNVCLEMGRKNDAIQYYRQALEIRRAHFGASHPAVASTIENIADLYFSNGDYIAALDYYRQAFSIQSRVQGEQSPATASLWHNIGLCYQYEGDFDRALFHHLAAAPIFIAALGDQHPLLAGLYNNLGNCYAGKKDFDQAAAAYQKALRIFLAAKPLQYSNITLVYNNLGDVFLEKKAPDTALKFFQKAFETLQSTPVNDPDQRAICLKNKALALDQLGRWPEAIQVFQLAIAAAESADPITENVILDDWGALLCQHGIQQQDADLLRQSIDVFEKSLQRSDLLRQRLNNPGSRQRWLELQFPVHNSAIEACFALWQLNGSIQLLEQAFDLAERNKSMQLLEQLRKEHAQEGLGIPDSILSQEQALNISLNKQEKALLIAQKTGNTSDIRLAENLLGETRGEMAVLQEQLSSKYPDYFRQRYNRNSVSIKAVQDSLLMEDQALLEYFVGDSAIFVFLVSPTDFQCKRLPRNFPLDEWVASLRNSLQSYPNAGEKAAIELSQIYVDKACQLYETILEPIQQGASLPKNLIIVPDGTLAYLPFECLLMERPQDITTFKRHHYLVRDHCLSYAYSASQQLGLLETISAKSPKKLLAVAPVYEQNRYGLGPLKNNQQEAEAVCELFDGQLLTGAAATVPAFLESADQYQILLLAMHGKASSAVGDMSYIAFSTGADTTENPFLYARDLYTQSIPADLVVLSACETSVGAYRFGQGVISLAKAFFQAGARSVAATLWSVDDAKNAELMRLFFKEIKSGHRKDEALRRSKLYFLDNHPHDEANPVYWAAVTAYGDMSSIEFGIPWSKYVIIALGFFGAIWLLGRIVSNR